jgi:hypothetical protein
MSIHEHVWFLSLGKIQAEVYIDKPDSFRL